MKALLVLFLFSFVSLAYGTQPDENYYRERDLETKISQLAQVQFGSDEVIAVRVRAVLAKKSIPADKQSADVGYLPLPYNGAAAAAEMKEELEGYDVNIMASSRANKAALQTFQNSVRRLVSPLRSKVNMQIVQFDEVKERKPASEPPKPVDNKEKDSNQITMRDYLYVGLILMSVLVGGGFLFFGVRSLGKALKSVGTNLEQSFRPAKTPDKVATQESVVKSVEDFTIYRKNENISQAMSVRQSVESLKRSCQSDPLKVVQCLGDAAEDVLGLRWLLSQLSDQERLEMKAFLGEDKIRALSKNVEAPIHFNVLHWAQSLIERISIRKLDRQSQLERALSNEEIAYMYRVPENRLLNFAKEQRDPKVWKLVLEVSSGEALSSMGLSNEDWNFVIEGQSLPVEVMKEAFQTVKASPDMLTSAGDDDNSKVHSVIVPNMIASIRLMKVSDERSFLEDLKGTQEGLYKNIKARFWSYDDLALLNQDRLRPVVASLSNEVLFSVLFVAPEQEREMLKEMIPQGMKRSVVLDLTDKALAKGDEQEMKAALKIARDFFDSLVKMNQTTPLYQQIERIA